MSIKVRRGLDAARLLVTFDEGEIVYTTDTKQVYVGDGATAGGISISDLTAGGHNHDDIYYTETEIDSFLNGKANNIHSHDDLYYTESETDTLLSGKANTVHNHDDLYYTESEVDNLTGRVKASSGDIAPLFLNNKILAGDGLVSSINNPNSVESLRIDADVAVSPISGRDMALYTDNFNRVVSPTVIPYQWAEGAINNNEWLQVAHATDARSGHIMLYGGYIIGFTIHCENDNGINKDIRLYKDNTEVGVMGTTQGVGGESTVVNTNFPIQVTQGEKLRLRGGTGGQILDTIVTVYVQWGA